MAPCLSNTSPANKDVCTDLALVGRLCASVCLFCSLCKASLGALHEHFLAGVVESCNFFLAGVVESCNFFLVGLQVLLDLLCRCCWTGAAQSRCKDVWTDLALVGRLCRSVCLFCSLFKASLGALHEHFLAGVVESCNFFLAGVVESCNFFLVGLQLLLDLLWRCCWTGAAQSRWLGHWDLLSAWTVASLEHLLCWLWGWCNHVLLLENCTWLAPVCTAQASIVEHEQASCARFLRSKAMSWLSDTELVCEHLELIRER